MKPWLVVTPTLGESEYLREAVASVRALGNIVHHRIVTPVEHAQKVVAIAPEAEVLVDNGMGLYAAINAAAWDVATRYRGFTWLNDDDRLVADGTRLACTAIDDGAAIAYGRVGLIDAEGAAQGWLPVCRFGADMGFLLARGIVAISQPGTWISSALWEHLNGVDESYRLGGDLDFFWRAAIDSAKFAYVPAVVAHFRLREGQLSQQAERGVEEKARVLGNARRSIALAARLRFSLGNCGVYFDRLQRHGFRSMAEIYRRGGESRR